MRTRSGPLLGLILTACAGAAGDHPSPVETAADLILALGDTGAWVARSGWTEAGAFGTPGEVLTVNGIAIEVYEYVDRAQRESVSLTIAPDGSWIAGLPIPWREPPHIWAAGALIVVYQGSDGPTVLLLDAILGDALVRTGGAGEEPYPPAVTAAIAALSQAMQVDPSRIEVVSFEEQVWPDSCLGLAAPDELCGMVLTPGWRVVLRAGGREVAARTDAAGNAVRFE